MLDFRPEEGRIFLQDMRILLINSTALGILRRDLIKTLGWERAKGFLTRFGWACGQEDAKLLKKNFNMDERDENVAGTMFHTQIGHTHVSPIEIKNNNSEEWFMEGIWTNSYEAEQHINYFGQAEAPVCWTLVGYAGGFRSECHGKRVIYKELECVGRGDQRCRFIGKTINSWGEEISSELPYYEESIVVEELAAAYSKIKAQHEILTRSTEVHEELIKLVLKGEGLSSISRALGAITQSAVLVVDQFSHSLIPKQQFDENIFIQIKKFFKDRRWEKQRKQLMAVKRPVLFDAEEKNLVHIVTPIISGTSILGFISLTKEKDKVSEIEFMASEQAATIFALKMMQDTAVAETENRLLGSFVHDLINGRYGDEETIMRRARNFNFDLKLPHHVFFIQNELWEEPRIHEIKLDNLRQQIIHTIKEHAASRSSQLLAVESRGGIVVLASINYKDEPEAIELAKKIKSGLEKRFSEQNFSIGIGRNCFSTAEYQQSYKEAQKAVKIAKSLNKSDDIVSFEALGVYSLLFNLDNKLELHQFTRDNLGTLLAMDHKNKSDLIETLETYLENNCNLAQTARLLNITVNGLRYRLSRIQEIGDIDLDDSKQRFDLQLALKVLRVIDKQ